MAIKKGKEVSSDSVTKKSFHILRVFCDLQSLYQVQHISLIDFHQKVVINLLGQQEEHHINVLWNLGKRQGRRKT
jgi:hypothetical protein